MTFPARIWLMPFAGDGYARVHQVGSHIILETEVPLTSGLRSPIIIRSGSELWHPSSAAVARHKGVTRDAILERL